MELWFSLIMPVALRCIELSEGAAIEKREDKHLKWVTYGSSIRGCLKRFDRRILLG